MYGKICVVKQCNNLWVSALETSFDAHFEDKKWQKCFVVGCVLLDFYNIFLPPYSVTKACVAINVSLSAFELENYEEAVKHIKLADTQLKMTHGTDHTYYKEVLSPLLPIIMEYGSET